MFPVSNFRDKLFQVQEEITNSLRTFVLAEPSSPLVIPSRCGKAFEGIPLDAGADLLNFYQFQWCRIRETSDQNFKLAEKTDKAIKSLADYVQQQHICASNLMSSLSSISTMTTQMEKITNSLALTEKLLADTELQLEILEENVKDKNLDKLMNDYAKKMQLLQDEKYAEFQQLKSHLALEHEKKIKENEVKQIMIAKERSLIFEEAFESEISQYKKSGVIPKLNLPPRQISNLEEIVVEDDPSVLNQFLEE